MRLILFSPGLGLLRLASLLSSRASGIETHLVIDNKYAPYGSRTPEEVSALVGAALSHVSPRHDDLVVIACNTSSHALTAYPLLNMPCQIINLEVETLRAIPGRFSRSDAVLLLGTKAVIDARVYERCLSGTGAVCTSIALPTLASLIDAEDWPAVADEIEACIPLGTPSTHVFLACTHYPLVLKYFQATLASRGLSDVPIISQERWLLESIESRLGGSFAAGAASSPMTVHLMRHSPPLIERLSNALSNIQIAPVPPQ